MDGVGRKLYCLVRRHRIVSSKGSMEIMVREGESSIRVSADE